MNTSAADSEPEQSEMRNCVGSSERIATLDDLAIIVVAEDDTITEWKAGAQRMLGYHEFEMVGRPMADIEDIWVDPVSAQAWPLTTAGAGLERERCYRHKSGRRVRCQSDAVTLDNSGKGARLWIVREASSEGPRDLGQHQACSRNDGNVDAAKDHGIAVMAHELKKPLATLLLCLEWLLEKQTGVDLQEMLFLVDTMRRTIRRQVRIINDLFDLSIMRIGKLRLDLTTVDLDDIVRSMVSDAAFRANDRKLRINIDAAASRLCVADPVRLEQILSNLLDNAVKFSGPGGLIEVGVESKNGYAVVSVSDSGCGISPEFLPHVFLMFSQHRRTASTTHAGVGIGLALVHELVQAHGGRVEVQSDGEGCGARFTMRLPITSEASTSRSVVLHPTPVPGSLLAQDSKEQAGNDHGQMTMGTRHDHR